MVGWHTLLTWLGNSQVQILLALLTFTYNNKAIMTEIPNWLKHFEDGDIIADANDNETCWVGIFKDVNEDGTFNTYCFMSRGTEKHFEPPHIYPSGELSTDNRGTYVEMQIANDIQRKRFFDVMQKWGYQWDVDKKELSKTKERLAFRPKHLICSGPMNAPCRSCSAGWAMPWTIDEKGSTYQWMCQCRSKLGQESIPSYNRECKQMQNWVANNPDSYDSWGAKVEYAFAQGKGMKVFYEQ